MRKISLTCRFGQRGLAALSSALACLALWSSLSGCRSDEYDLVGMPQGGPAGSVRFSAGDPATRTTMAAGGRFYWVPGDSIWVFDGTRWVKNYASSITAKATGAEFYFYDGDNQQTVVFTDSLYSVRYTGNGAGAKRDEVTILDQQVQSEPDNSDHFGISGDCATATATLRLPKNYEFTLYHRACYLVFEPRIVSGTAAEVRLTKVAVEKALSLPDTLCGTYSFGESGLGYGNAQDAKSRVELTCTGGFELADTFACEKNRSFMVIQPGQHTLRITYTFEADGVEHTAMATLPARPYNENMYVTIRHRLDWDGTAKGDDPYDNYDPDDPPTNMYDDGIYYMWDAQNWYWHGVQYYPRSGMYNSNGPVNITGGGNYDEYPKDASDARNRWKSESAFPAEGQASCAEMPNANEMYWYLVNGLVNLQTGGYLNNIPTLSFPSGLQFLKKDVILAMDGQPYYQKPTYNGYDVHYVNHYICETNFVYFVPCNNPNEPGHENALTFTDDWRPGYDPVTGERNIMLSLGKGFLYKIAEADIQWTNVPFGTNRCTVCNTTFCSEHGPNGIDLRTATKQELYAAGVLMFTNYSGTVYPVSPGHNHVGNVGFYINNIDEVNYFTRYPIVWSLDMSTAARDKKSNKTWVKKTFTTSWSVGGPPVTRTETRDVFNPMRYHNWVFSKDNTFVVPITSTRYRGGVNEGSQSSAMWDYSATYADVPTITSSSSFKATSYWTSTASFDQNDGLVGEVGGGAHAAYAMTFSMSSSSRIETTYFNDHYTTTSSNYQLVFGILRRDHGCIAGTRPEGTPWFQ